MTAITASTTLHALARFGHALSDSTRVQILTLLSESPRYPADMADAIGATRQSISNHLACLRGCGLVISEASGRRTRYKLADDRINHAIKDLREIVLHTDPALCPSLEREECC